MGEGTLDLRPWTLDSLQNVHLPDGRGPLDVHLGGGRVRSFARGLRWQSREVFDAAGRLLSPAFVEPHIHLDKALTIDRTPGEMRNVQEAIHMLGRLKATFTRQDIRERAERTLRMALRHGTTYFRAHAEIDPVLGLRGVEAMLELREAYRGVVQMQLVAFPQEGIFQAPGIAELMEEALRLGVDVVGGIPYNDPDPREHIDFVFELAQRHGKPVDFHADFGDDARTLSLPYIAEKTGQTGYGGRVAVGHANALASLAPSRAARLIEALREAGVAIIALPATDLTLSGHRDRVNPRRGLTRVRELLRAGVRLACSSNNIRNVFTPFGNADPLENALLMAIVAHLAHPDGIREVYRTVTTEAAAILGIRDYALKPGGRANLVLLDAPDIWEALVSQAEKRLVIANGRVVVENLSDSRLSIPLDWYEGASPLIHPNRST